MLDVLMLTLLLQMRFLSPGCTAGEGWEFVLRTHQAEKSPRWHEDRDAPPLAPREAIRAARSLLHAMSCPDADAWELAAVALRPIAGERDVWVYLVTFVEPLWIPSGVLGAVSRRPVDVPVLLDGTALMPSVGTWPPAR